MQKGLKISWTGKYMKNKEEGRLLTLNKNKAIISKKNSIGSFLMITENQPKNKKRNKNKRTKIPT